MRLSWSDAVHVSIACLPLVLGSLAGSLTADDAAGDGDGDGGPRWLSRLDRPALTPPSIVFPIVWPILYVLLGVSTFSAVTGKPLGPVLVVYAALFAHMAANLSFPFAQMGLRDLYLARAATWATFFTALLLAAVFVALSGPAMPAWRNVLPVALLVPYLLWLAFAAFLSTSLFALNRPGRAVRSPSPKK